MNQFQEVAGKIASHQKTPLVLTIVSCVGVIGTAYLAARAAPKASRILKELQKSDEYRYDAGVDTFKKIPFWAEVKHTWKVYIPAASVGAATIATIVTMNRITDRNVAILTAGATLATNTLKDYQQHILEEIGAEKESRVRDHMAKDQLAKTVLPESEVGFVYTDGDVLCFDSLSGRYFRHNLEKVRSIENDLNRMLLSEMSMPLNDVYDALDMEHIDLGDILGFNMDNMLDFHFSAQLNPEKKPVLVLGYINMPIPNYDR